MVMKKLPQRPVDNSVPRKSFEERIREGRQNRLREEALAETKESMDEIVDGDATLQGDDSIVQDVVNESFPTSIKFPRHQARKAAGTEKGVLTIVSAGKFGHRLIFPEKVISYMGSTDKAQIGLADKGIMVIEKPTSEEETEGLFPIRKQGKSYMVYSAPLVKELVASFSLDYSNTVSKTFMDAEYGEYEGRKAVYIKLV